MLSEIQQLMLKLMLDIQKNGPKSLEFGLCHNLSEKMRFNCPMAELEILFQSWPLFSGDITFPVPSSAAAPDDAYLYRKGSMWDRETEYGANRWLLLEHCIVQLSKGQS